MFDEKREAVALFRYGLISQFIHTKIRRGELKARFAEVASQTYHVSWQQTPVEVTVPSLLRWRAQYR